MSGGSNGGAVEGSIGAVSHAMPSAQSNTLPGLLLARAAAAPSAQALRHHHLGIWEPLSWSSLAERTRNLGNALVALGIGEQEVVGLLAANEPRWIAADLAVQGLGAITLAIDPGFSPGTVVTLLQTHAASTVIVGDQQQYDKVADSLRLLPLLRRIIVMEARGIRILDEPDDEVRSGVSAPAVEVEGRLVRAFDSLEADGAHQPDVWTQRATTLDPAWTCTVEAHLDRSTGGAPALRAHPATSASLLAAADDLAERLGAHAGDELYPVASFADPVERSLSVAMTLRVGAVLNIGEGGLLQSLELRSVQPTIAHLPAAHLHGIRDDIERRRATRGLRKFAVDRLLNGQGKMSASAVGDRRVTFGLLATVLGAAVLIHRLLVNQHGLIRIGIIALLASVVGIVLVVGGYGVRPFVRRAYGLGSAHSLLTSPDLNEETRHFLGALHLAPIIEQRRPNAFSGPTDHTGPTDRQTK